jgi:hypothetical protein
MKLWNLILAFVKQLNLPSRAKFLLAIAGGVATALLQSGVFGWSPKWQNDLSMLVIALGAITGPLLGSAFVAALHVPLKVCTAITIVLSLAGIGAMQIPDLTARGIVFGLITALGYLGFGPVADEFDVGVVRHHGNTAAGAHGFSRTIVGGAGAPSMAVGGASGVGGGGGSGGSSSGNSGGGGGA